MDGDVVESSNLHRQPLYEVADIGRRKAVVAAERISRMNREVACQAIAERAEPGNLDALVEGHDLVIECTDNLRTKFLVNDAVVRAAKPAVFASVYQYEGQVQAWLPTPDWPCLRCLWPEAPRDGLVGNCAEAGVLGPVPGTIGTMQAMLALRILLDMEHSPNDLENLVTQLQAAAPYPTTPIVRVPWNDMVTIKRVLDVGAQSLLIPYVQTEEEARNAVGYTRYPPQGVRGFATGPRANHYGRITDYVQTYAEELCVLVQVETRRTAQDAT